MYLDTEERRIAGEAISSLVNIKNVMVEMLLKPAGVPPEVYKPLLTRRDPLTGYALSKRELAPLILDAIEGRPNGCSIIRNIIEIAANWSNYHLAHDEYAARATVQKATEILKKIKTIEANEAAQREQERQEELARTQQRQSELFTKHSALLLQWFDELADFSRGDEQRRGYLLQDLLNQVFTLHNITVTKSFTRNEGGEQIDGGFRLDGWHYLVECRWRQKLSDIAELDGLKGKVGRSGKQTMGFFLSMNGWSPHVIPLLKQNQDKCIILMQGHDLRVVLAKPVDLQDFLLAKIAKFNFEGEPFFGVLDYLSEEEGRGNRQL